MKLAEYIFQSEYMSALSAMSGLWVAAGIITLIILTGFYVRRHNSTVVHNINISAPANDKPTVVRFINPSGIDFIKVNLFHVPSKETVSRMYRRVDGNFLELVVLGGNKPSATTVSVHVEWM